MDHTKYDFKLDILLVNNNSYSLKDYRKWLLNNHETLCQKHFIKALTIGGVTKFTFDWQGVYNTSERYNFLKNFIDEQTK